MHIRVYIDVHGDIRTAYLIEQVPWLTPYGIAHRWRLDGESIVQIPDMAWDLVEIVADSLPW